MSESMRRKSLRTIGYTRAKLYSWNSGYKINPYLVRMIIFCFIELLNLRPVKVIKDTIEKKFRPKFKEECFPYY